MTQEHPWSHPRTRGLPQEVNGTPLPLDSVVGRMILAEQTKGNIKLDHILHELHFLPDRIARSVSVPRKPRGSLRQYTDFLQALGLVMLLSLLVAMSFLRPDLFLRLVEAFLAMR